MRHILHGQATDFFEVFYYLKREVWGRCCQVGGTPDRCTLCWTSSVRAVTF
jgi:hypothetical protein